MIGNIGTKVDMMPILPHLVTTTDKVTIFATAGTISKKGDFYLFSRPESIKNEASHSGCRNHYKKTPCDDSHCRGLQIVIHSTFTAGGLSAPFFFTIFGLSKEGMRKAPIITVTVPGLCAGSNQDLYSKGEGMITFVRGNDNSTVKSTTGNARNDDDSNNMVDTINVTPNSTYSEGSRESQVASLYRRRIYYPFIKKIREDIYGFNGPDDKCPDYLRAVSLMDGCSSQLKQITTAENMEIEQKLKITCCKHSAARTAVEQAADTGCMFKEMKRVKNSTKNPNTSNSSVYRVVENLLASLECKGYVDGLEDNHQILNLPLHKNVQ